MTTASAAETESVFSAEKKVEGRSVRVDMEFPRHAAVGETVPLTVALSFDRQISGAFPSVSVTWKKTPDGASSPEVLPGVPVTDVRFSAPGHYEMEAEIGTQEQLRRRSPASPCRCLLCRRRLLTLHIPYREQGCRSSPCPCGQHTGSWPVCLNMLLKSEEPGLLRNAGAVKGLATQPPNGRPAGRTDMIGRNAPAETWNLRTRNRGPADIFKNNTV